MSVPSLDNQKISENDPVWVTLTAELFREMRLCRSCGTLANQLGARTARRLSNNTKVVSQTQGLMSGAGGYYLYAHEGVNQDGVPLLGDLGLVVQGTAKDSIVRTLLEHGTDLAFPVLSSSSGGDAAAAQVDEMGEAESVVDIAQRHAEDAARIRAGAMQTHLGKGKGVYARYSKARKGLVKLAQDDREFKTFLLALVEAVVVAEMNVIRSRDTKDNPNPLRKVIEPNEGYLDGFWDRLFDHVAGSAPLLVTGLLAASAKEGLGARRAERKTPRIEDAEKMMPHFLARQMQAVVADVADMGKVSNRHLTCVASVLSVLMKHCPQGRRLWYFGRLGNTLSGAHTRKLVEKIGARERSDLANLKRRREEVLWRVVIAKHKLTKAKVDKLGTCPAEIFRVLRVGLSARWLRCDEQKT